MTRPYRPSNGTEGLDFMEFWCARCRHDSYPEDYESKQCEILTVSLCEDDPPTEWVQDDDGYNPRCTAFEEVVLPGSDNARAELEAAGQLTLKG